MILGVWSGGDLVGAVYAGEAYAWKVPVGVAVVGHPPGPCTVTASEELAEPVFIAALLRLLRSRRYHTIYAHQAGRESADPIANLSASAPGVSIAVSPVTIREQLPLANSFDCFLRGLGYHTRRNLRYYRRRASAVGIQFHSHLAPAQVADALRQLVPHQRTSQHSVRQLNHSRNSLESVSGAFWCGLRNPAGAWVSIVGGCVSEDRASIILQLNNNDPEYDSLSLSAVVRSCLIENLIGSGVKVLSFVGGCNGLLQPYCVPEYSTQLVIEKPGAVPTAIRRVGRQILKAKGLLA